MKNLMLSLVFTASAAYAGGGEHHVPTPQGPPRSTALSAAVANGGSADQHQVQGQAQSAKAQQEQRSSSSAAGGDGIGTVTDITDYNSKAFALSLPLSAVAAPAVITDCLRHSRGWSAALGVAARTGGTEYDAACVERVKCLQLADRLASWNQGALAVKQLQACGAVAGEYEAKPVTTSVPAQDQDLSQYVKRDELTERDRRMVEKLMGK